jgi:hypothetical protein
MPSLIYTETGTLVRLLNSLSPSSCSSVMYMVVEIFFLPIFFILAEINMPYVAIYDNGFIGQIRGKCKKLGYFFAGRFILVLKIWFIL